MSKDTTRNPSTSKRTPVPISASAFAFTLPSTTTPSKPTRPLSSVSAFAPSASKRTPARSTIESIVTSVKSVTSASKTPHRSSYQHLDSLPRLFFNRPNSPSGAASSKPRKHIQQIFESSPFRDGEKIESRDDDKGLRLGDIPGWGEDIGRSIIEKRRSELVDEGTGVSPRKKKTLRHTGHGPLPPSTQLANLLSASSSSLHLFYTSLQHTLHPVREYQRSSMPHRTPLERLRTAPLHLFVGSAVSGPTHQGIIFRCAVSASQGIKAPTTRNQDTLGEVLVVFQPLPAECPRLGTDPRAVAAKLADRSWEVGIWEPWTEISGPLACGRRKASVYEGQRRGEEVEETIVREAKERSVRMILPSRYLIAEALLQ